MAYIIDTTLTSDIRAPHTCTNFDTTAPLSVISAPLTPFTKSSTLQWPRNQLLRKRSLAPAVAGKLNQTSFRSGRALARSYDTLGAMKTEEMSPAMPVASSDGDF